MAAFFSKKQKKLAESLLKEEEKRPDRWRRREEAPVPVVSPDKKWEAYVKDNNLYLSPLWDEKEKEKPKEVIALTMDGTALLRYDGWSIIWSPVARLPEAGNRESARRAGTPHSADRIQPV